MLLRPEHRSHRAWATSVETGMCEANAARPNHDPALAGHCRCPSGGPRQNVMWRGSAAAATCPLTLDCNRELTSPRAIFSSSLAAYSPRPGCSARPCSFISRLSFISPRPAPQSTATQASIHGTLVVVVPPNEPRSQHASAASYVHVSLNRRSCRLAHAY